MHPTKQSLISEEYVLAQKQGLKNTVSKNPTLTPTLTGQGKLWVAQSVNPWIILPLLNVTIITW